MHGVSSSAMVVHCGDRAKNVLTVDMYIIKLSNNRLACPSQRFFRDERVGVFAFLAEGHYQSD